MWATGWDELRNQSRISTCSSQGISWGPWFLTFIGEPSRDGTDVKNQRIIFSSSLSGMDTSQRGSHSVQSVGEETWLDFSINQLKLCFMPLVSGRDFSPFSSFPFLAPVLSLRHSRVWSSSNAWPSPIQAGIPEVHCPPWSWPGATLRLCCPSLLCQKFLLKQPSSCSAPAPASTLNGLCPLSCAVYPSLGQ